MVTHTLKSDEAMDAYYRALETMSEADVRGATTNDRASFQMQWNVGKAENKEIVGRVLIRFLRRTRKVSKLFQCIDCNFFNSSRASQIWMRGAIFQLLDEWRG